MPEKGMVVPAKQWLLHRSSPMHQWRLGVLTALVFVGVLAVWSLDGCSIKDLVQAWRLKQQDHYFSIKVNLTMDPTQIHENLTLNFDFTNRTEFKNLVTEISANLTGSEDTQKSKIGFEVVASSNNATEKIEKSSGVLRWVSAELEANLTTNLLGRWLAPGGEPCKDSRTVDISIPDLVVNEKEGEEEKLLSLSVGEIHEFSFQALDESGNPRCVGGDYFETDLSGESWKSRPLVKDFGNGTYSLSLQVHPDFAGDYNLTVILLFRHFEGLRFSPHRFAFDRTLRHIPIRFIRSKVVAHELPSLKICQKSDFSRDVWSGRWTRHGKNDACEISRDGRYRCLASNFKCREPWCHGSLGKLESNGWVYSTHCSFKMFTADSAWNCLKNRWIFFWGDSNHVDTIRNMLNFVLDMPYVSAVPRRFDMKFTNPKNPSQSVRITSIFNGHSNETKNYEGLDSLKDEGFRNLLKKYFSEETVPDTIIMNSGLHDGVHFSTLRAFSKAAGYAATFWKEVMDSVRQRGLAVPKIIYRTTVATGGHARTLAFNPSKMEAFNGVVLDKLRQTGLVSGVIDNFDMTFPWHYDNRCSDGVHYGRAPSKSRWRDGEIGHQYFVDLMLAHVLLNALCAK